MSELSDFLLPNEKEIFVTRPHWVVYGTSALFFLATIISMVLPFAMMEISAMIGGFALVSYAYSYVTRNFTLYAVTNKRVLIKSGIISRSTSGVLMRKIESVEVYQSITGRILGFGDVLIRGTGGGVDVIMKIEKPFVFRKHLAHMLSEVN